MSPRASAPEVDLHGIPPPAPGILCKMFISWTEMLLGGDLLIHEMYRSAGVTRPLFIHRRLSVNPLKEIRQRRSLWRAGIPHQRQRGRIQPISTCLLALVIGNIDSFNDFHALFSTVLVSHFFLFLFFFNHLGVFQWSPLLFISSLFYPSTKRPQRGEKEACCGRAVM